MSLKTVGYSLPIFELGIALAIAALCQAEYLGIVIGWSLSTVALYWALPGLCKDQADFQSVIIKVLGQSMARGAMIVGTVAVVGFKFREIAIPFAGALVGCYFINLAFELLLIAQRARQNVRGNG